jgi:hypothetical protein
MVGALVMGSLFLRVKEDLVGLRQRQSFFGFSLSFVLFTSSQTLPLVAWERQIFIRETTRGAYSSAAYVLAGKRFPSAIVANSEPSDSIPKCLVNENDCPRAG